MTTNEPGLSDEQRRELTELFVKELRDTNNTDAEEQK